MISDDTEHTCFVAQALIRSPDCPSKFQKHLARSLKWWLLGLPAGIGLATLRSIVKLSVGVSPDKSGVYSAGNGPAMRSALLGIMFGDDPQLLERFVQRCTRITHTDPKAFYGALAVALAAHLASTGKTINTNQLRERLKDRLKNHDAGEFLSLLRRTIDAAEKKTPIVEFAHSIGSKKGISGYIYHTVPCAILAWLKNQHDYRTGLLELIRAGGDTDTTGAIYGAIAGASVGKEGIPPQWLDGIVEWPKTTRWMERLGRQLSALQKSSKPAPYPKIGMIPRNLLFTIIVLFHGFRRLLPPY